MRPRLDPLMGETALCARVAFQLVAIRYRRSLDRHIPPPALAAFVARSLPPDYPGFLKFALHSLGIYLDMGMPSSQWLSNVLEAARYGHSFRRCFFFDYKGNRGAYPRVTNRGVHSSPPQTLVLNQRKGGNE